MLNNLKPTGVIDLGSCETKFIIFLVKEAKVEILAKSIIKTQGIRKGIISDLNKLSDTIKEVIGTAEEQAKIQIQNIYLAPSPLNIYNTSFSVFKNIGGYEIEQEKDVQFLINGGVDLFKEFHQNYSILHLINSNLRIDKYNQVDNPLNLAADSLESDMHIMYCKNNLIKNFQKIINKSYLKLGRIIYSPYALSLLGHRESPLSENIMSIDFGHEKTSLSIFKNDNFEFTSTVPIGSWHITNDISKALNLNMEIAENLKINYGTCSTDQQNISKEYIESQNSEIKSYKKVSNNILNKIITSRVEEVIDFMNKELLFYSTNEKFFNKIIVTGEGSKMRGFQNLLKKNLSIKSLIIENFNSKLKTDIPDNFDICISMISLIVNRYNKEIPYFENVKKNFFEKLYSIFN